MKKHDVQKVMLTNIYIRRERLITKEKMKNVCKGKEDEKLSVNDDLETLFENILLGEEPKDDGHFYFLPRLTEHEFELVERKDEEFMRTFNHGIDADVNKAEMAASESDSKYVYAWGERKTITIENQSYLIEGHIESDSDDDATPPFKILRLNSAAVLFKKL